MAWSDYAHNPGDLDYLSTWLTARLAFLDSTFNIPCGPSDVKERGMADFALYPNPTSGQVQIVLEDAIAPAELSLTDATGRTILLRTLQGERATVDLGGLQPGMYLVHLHRKGHSTTSRLVII